MLQKCVRLAALFFVVVLSIGCSSDGVFETPDSIRVTTLTDIHGRRGHRIDIHIGPNNANPADAGMTKQVVLELHDPDVSTHTLYPVIETDSIGIGRMVDLLHKATEITVVPDLPEDTEPLTRMWLTLGGKEGDSFSGYLRVVAPSETAYLSLRGVITKEYKAWFFRTISNPPEVLDTMPVRVVDISYYLNPDFTEPITDTAYVGDTVYTRVEFSKAPPVVVAGDGSALPHLSSTARSGEFQYRVVTPHTPLESGEAKPYQNTDHIFICKYVIRGGDFADTFRSHASHGTVSGAILPVRFFEYTGAIPANVGETITTWNPTDFVGQVYTMRITELRETDRNNSVPLAGVTVTIASGPRQGEHIVTDRNGRYRFLNVPGDTLHLRVERHRFEPKEVIVHRSRPTALANGIVPNYRGDPQRNPGNILIGHVWPEEAREFLERNLVVHDLLYVDLGRISGWDEALGFYSDGLAAVFSTYLADLTGLSIGILSITVHEIMHAHQDAMVSVDGSGSTRDWVNTPEGRAFVAAREKDVAGAYTTSYDRIPGYASDLENAAQTVAEYWAIEYQWEEAVVPIWSLHQAGKTLQELIPNRYQWCEEWIKKK